MRVTSVEMYSATFEEPINFSLRDLDPLSRYQVRTIIGLDAEELVPKFYGRGYTYGEKFYDFGMKPRDIVARIVLNPDYRLNESPSDIRDDLYRAISADRSGRVVLHFKSGGTVVSRIFGFITKFEVPYFTKLPEVQITIRCDDPLFRGINPVVFEAADLPTDTTLMIPDSLSTAPHGFTMHLTFTNPVPSLTIRDTPADSEWQFKVTPSGGFLTGDILFFSSEFSNKFLYISRGATHIDLIDKIEPTSIWPLIFPGRNDFFFVEALSFDWSSIEYYAAYWGV